MRFLKSISPSLRSITLGVGFVFLPFSGVMASSEEDFERFRSAMIERDCWFRNDVEGKLLQKELGMSNGLFSEVMLRLALKGEFICPGGCKLIHPECPKED